MGVTVHRSSFTTLHHHLYRGGPILQRTTQERPSVLRYIPSRATPAADVRCNLLIFLSYSRLQDTAARLSSFKASSSSTSSSTTSSSGERKFIGYMFRSPCGQPYNSSHRRATHGNRSRSYDGHGHWKWVERSEMI